MSISRCFGELLSLVLLTSSFFIKCETIYLVMLYVNLILDTEDDNVEETPLNYDVQFNPMEILSMKRRMKFDTQVICIDIKEAVSSFNDYNIKFVKQSAK